MEVQLEAVQRMQNYIGAHLCEEITLADLSRASHFSPWHAHRLFALYTGKTPSEYIRRLRLSQSALKLRDERCKIIDVALELGFKSVDGYRRAFLREFGVNPYAYAKNPVPLYLFTPYGVQSSAPRKEKAMEKVKTVFVQEVQKPARKALIKRGVKAGDYFAYCEEVGCDIWGLLISMKSISGEPVSMWLPEAYIAPNTSKYVQGVEVDPGYTGPVPEGFDCIELPAATYLMFRGEPFAEEDYCEAIEAIWEAVEKYDPAIINAAWDKENPRIQLEPVGARGYIELVPIRKL